MAINIEKMNINSIVAQKLVILVHNPLLMRGRISINNINFFIKNAVIFNFTAWPPELIT